ncbi:helix-turn-helix transcriptional regulator [Alkalicella caledoniensis]|uniref:Helix-turn-helix transcriptional regulator n=1 Tax=Alkalicella caledoniensis TaxID=2731377 RepID=A0A7G9W9M9_ALKCA|nr:helix-turn-helix transcriptional regulator [Alkalicella caledoniensis]QNO15391.1 helix-turn-helix transcriptional regulator [Alkalicella caledoniensis]
MSFGENLRKLRKERGLSQEQLAEKINVSRQAVSKWEQGGGYPETEKIILIAKNLNVSLDYLLVGIESEEKSEMRKEKNVVPTGKISIRTFDGKTVVTCHKVSVSNVILAGKDEPKYVLNGVDKVSFWGENTTTLGWYANEEDIKKEIVDITKAINGGLQAYDLKYAAKVKIGIIGVKLE